MNVHDTPLRILIPEGSSNRPVGLWNSTDSDWATVLTTFLEQRTYAETPSLVSTALVARPDVKAMEARVKAGEESVTAASGGWWPNIFLVGTYTYARPNSRIFPTRDQFDGTAAAVASATASRWMPTSTATTWSMSRPPTRR